MTAQVVPLQHVGEIRAFAERLLTSVFHDRAVLAAYGDFTCSPTGLWLALSAVASGAGSETARELRELLGLAGPEAASAVTEVTALLAQTEGVAAATGVWSRIPVYRDYRERLPDVGFGGRPARGLGGARAPKADRRRPGHHRAPAPALHTRLPAERLLASLGAPLAGSGLADFSGMSPEPLRVDRLIQESVLRIDEEGVQAQAVTQVWKRRLGRGLGGERTRHIAFDRPFGLVVFAGSTGLPLFTAWQGSAPRSPYL